MWRRMALGLLLGLPVLSVGGLYATTRHGEKWIVYRQRIAERQREQAADAAVKSFNQDVAPLLDKLKPDNVSPIQNLALRQLFLPKPRRNATLNAEIEAKLAELQSLGNQAVELLSTPETGVEPIDRVRETAKEFMEARLRSFVILNEMLAAERIPDDATMTAWIDVKNKADALCNQLRHKP
jgi:hypothetical protein